MKFSQIEIKHLLKSWILVSVIFTVASLGIRIDFRWFIILFMMSITVGTGFLLHEIAHKAIAQRFGYLAEYRSDDRSLILSFLFALAGFVFFAPGAVIIHSRGHMDQKKNGLISIAGPVTNLLLAIIFLALNFFEFQPFLDALFKYGFQVNTMLGLFNLIPAGNFDGAKVLRWNKIAYGVCAGIALGLFLFSRA